MGNTIEEIRYQVGEAWKGEYNSNTPYGVAAVVQDPTGLSIYRSLKNGNTGHPLTDKNWWFCIIDMSSIKEASDDVDALNTRVTEAEDGRVEAENNRVTAENSRVTAESGRVTAESSRVSAENARVTAESGRVSAESARATAESSRATAESGRVSAEQSRVLAENLRDNAESGRATAETNRASAESERHTQYTADHNTAVSDHTTAQLDHTTAVADHEQATADHTASVAATSEASNVDAELDGLTVTITDRDGNSHSVNIGFDIAGTYASVSAMNADAANVQEGAFVMIATSDPTSAENARLYVRNSTAPSSSEPFTFLSDLDQASTSAWADWMENYKPTIIADHQRAETDHSTAAADHTTAVADHTASTTDHTQAASDHSTAASDHTAAASDHTRAESDHTTAAADHTQAESDHSRAETDHNTMESRIANLEENKANNDGYYSQMTVGSAEKLVGQTIDSEAYLIRPTGGESNEVANGVASVLDMEGNSTVWNQLVKNGGFTSVNTWATRNCSYSVSDSVATITASSQYAKLSQPITINTSHRYYISVYIKTDQTSWMFGIGQENTSTMRAVLFSSGASNWVRKVWTTPVTGLTGENEIFISNRDSSSSSIQVRDFKVIDLTLLGIDNLTTVAQVEAWLAQHVGTKPYYGYNEGSLLSAQTLGIKTYGQNLLNPTTRQARLIPYEWEENSNVYTIKNVPSGATATFTPDATGVAVTVDISGGSLDITSYGSGILELSAATADTYVCMKWNEQKDDDVVPYEDHTQEFDVRKVYGKNNGVEYQCYPNGLRGIGNVKDILTASEAVVRIGSVDLGNSTWASQQGNIFRISIADIKQTVGVPIIINSGKYERTLSVYSQWDNQKNYYGTRNSYDRVYFQDLSCSTVEQIAAAMSGVMLDYELATPITYTDLVYRDGGIDRPLVDALFNIDVDNWSIEEQLLTPYDENGNPTAVPAKISIQYGMDAVEEIDTIKHTYVSAYNEQNFSDNQKAQARRNIGAVEANGTYPNMSVGIAKNLAGENAVEAEYTYRPSNGTIGTATGIANVTAVKGKTLKWQQLVQNGDFSDGTTGWSANGVTASVSDGVCSITFGTNTTNLTKTITNPYPNKVLVKIMYKSETTNVTLRALGGMIPLSESSVWTEASAIFNPNNTGNVSLVATSDAAENKIVQVKSIMVFDLTDLFGAGNEPSTVAEFEALYPLDYYPFNAGTLINNKASAIVTTGFNQWDEEWELGTYNTNTGATASSTSYIRSKSTAPIRVFPSTVYATSALGMLKWLWYDINDNFIETTAGHPSTVQSPANAAYLRFFVDYSAYGTTYKNDICINISDTAKNGTYEPYEKHTFYFDKVLQGEGSLATIKGKLNGEGESVVVFPDGLKRACNAYDEIKGNIGIKRIGSVDMGDLSWSYYQGVFYAAVDGIKVYASGSDLSPIICSKYITVARSGNFASVDGTILQRNIIGDVSVKDSNYSDAATFKVAMSGVILYYELATPETYILDQTVTGGYQVNANGTERRLPEDTASAVNAPVSYSVIYPIDAVGNIIKLPINYISEKSLTNFTTELASKLGTFLSATIGVTATYNQTTQEYDYSITITSNE